MFWVLIRSYFIRVLFITERTSVKHALYLIMIYNTHTRYPGKTTTVHNDSSDLYTQRRWNRARLALHVMSSMMASLPSLLPPGHVHVIVVCCVYCACVCVCVCFVCVWEGVRCMGRSEVCGKE